MKLYKDRALSVQSANIARMKVSFLRPTPSAKTNLPALSISQNGLRPEIEPFFF